MLLLECPSEIIQPILVYAILIRGVKRALRLRLVSKRFSAELEPALFNSRIFDTANSYYHSHFWPADCTNRVLNHNDDSQCTATIIKITAKTICQERGVFDESALQNTVYKLCELAIRAFCIGPTWLAHKEEVPIDFDLHLLSAAAHLGCESLVKRLTSAGYNTRYSKVFGCPMKAAIRQGHKNILCMILACIRANNHPTTWIRKIGLLAAGPVGHLGVLEVLLSTEWGPFLPSDEGLLGKLKIAMTLSPNLACYNRLFEVATSLDPKFEFSDLFLGSGLNFAAKGGHEDMVRHFLHLGASTISFNRCGTLDDCYDNNPLCSAVIAGRNDIVQVLLDAGASPNPGFVPKWGSKGDPLAYAASLGALSAVRMLVDAGANVNTNKPSAIFYAIQREDIAMFRLLRKHGADLNHQGVGTLAMRMAAEEGLDSMIKLLSEEGVVEGEGLILERKTSKCIDVITEETQ